MSMSATNQTPPLPSRRSLRKQRRSPLPIISEAFFMLGLIALGFIVWQEFTEHSLSVAQEQSAVELVELWAAEPVPSEPLPEDPIEEEPLIPTPPLPELGKGFAVLRIPAFGESYQRIITHGTSLSILNDPKTGVGHYTSTALPGEVGNFSIAGHRRGNGGVFLNLDKLRMGDEISVQIQSTVYTYRVTEEPFVVKPHEVWVLDSKPGKRELTITTCTPMWSFHDRLIVKAELSDVVIDGRSVPLELLDSAGQLQEAHTAINEALGTQGGVS